MPNKLAWIAALALLPLLAFLSLLIGSVSIPAEAFFGEGSEIHRIIIRESRVPRTLTAILGGASLSLGGLFMQTLFRNPLAGPSVLGLTSGSSLAVAFVTMAGGVAVVTEFGTVAASAIGAIAVLMVLLLVAHRFSDITSVLIVGLMLSFFTSAAVSILQAHADDSALKAFVFWGFGSFSQISFERLPLLVIPVLFFILISPVFIKPLNNLLPGELHAKTMGVRVGRLRLSLVLLTGIMVGTVTAFCGPIAFIGLAGPHIARFAFSTPNHRTILPASLVLGSVLALACDLISRLPGTDYALPLNTVCAFMGAPVVIYLIFKGRKKRIFT